MSNLWTQAALEQIEAAKPIPTHSENLENYLHERMHSSIPLPHAQTLDEFGDDNRSFWHGSPNGIAGMVASHYGVHVGTKQAAKEALEARIGRRADGQDWDGTQEYGKTLVGGYGHGYGSDYGIEPHYPNGKATYSGGVPIPLSVRPHLFPVRIIGGMTNSTWDPHPDWHANGYMSAQIKRGRARNGYYYRNEGEDAGSISAVVPSAAHLATHEQFVRHLHNQITEHNARGGIPHFLTGTIHPENVERYGLE